MRMITRYSVKTVTEATAWLPLEGCMITDSRARRFSRQGRHISLMLLFKKKFLQPIRDGEKTQTIRLWRHRQMREGQRSYIPGAGYIRVTCVEQVELDQLTDDDAKPDGFESAEALLRELNTLYADKLNDGYRAFRVVFELFPPEEQERIKAERQKEKAAKKT